MPVTLWELTGIATLNSEVIDIERWQGPLALQRDLPAGGSLDGCAAALG
jgi:hypothetical protein